MTNPTTSTDLPEYLEHIGILDSSIVALLGYIVVFVGLIFLMIVVMILGKIFVAAANRGKAVKEAPAPAPVAPVAAPAVTSNEAPGTAGELKLYDTPPKTAAMIMAIVAEKLGKPINELRFISIKEVK